MSPRARNFYRSADDLAELAREREEGGDKAGAESARAIELAQRESARAQERFEKRLEENFGDKRGKRR